MILAEYIRVVDISWEDHLWFFFWILMIFSVVITGIIITVVVETRKWFIKNELPRLHDKEIEKGRKKNKLLQQDNKILMAEIKELEIKCDSLRVRFLLIKNSFDEAAKEQEVEQEADHE